MRLVPAYLFAAGVILVNCYLYLEALEELAP